MRFDLHQKSTGTATAEHTLSRAMRQLIWDDNYLRFCDQLPVSDWVLDKPMTPDAQAAELEHGGDAESDADNEEDGPPMLVAAWGGGECA